MSKSRVKKRILALIGIIAVSVTSVSGLSMLQTKANDKVEISPADAYIDEKLKEFETKNYSPEELGELKNHLIYDTAEYLGQIPTENEVVEKKKTPRLIDTSINHVVGAEFTYGSWFTNFFTANGNPAYCVQPMVITPPTGKYGMSQMYDNSTRIAKGLYYWYGGPGAQYWRDNFGNLGTVSELIPESESGMTHALLSYLYDPNGNAFQGMPQDWIDALLAQIPILDSLPSAPKGFEAFGYNLGASTQGMVGWEYTPYGKLQIKKVSGNPELTDNNSCYEIAGAYYQVYYPDTNVEVGGLLINEQGLSPVIEIPAGDYDILEAIAPKGFALDPIKKRVTILPGETNTKFVDKPFVDYPQNDPVRMWVGKIDLETTLEMPQGSASLAGAHFKIKYYDGFYGKVDPAKYGQTPRRSWVVATNKNGFAQLHQDYFVSGDKFYCDSFGRITIPLGTVTAQEVKAPDGYLLNDPTVYVREIRSGGSFLEAVETYDIPVVKEQIIRGDLEFVKMSDTDHKRLANVPFKITSKTTGESHTIVTDENGQAKTQSDWVKHSQNTNKGTSSEDGIWFGNIAELDDSKGALIYDTYIIEEVRCKTNEEYDLIPPFEVVIKKDNVIVDLGTLTNDYTPIPEISTQASFEKTGSKVEFANGEVTIVDTVSYKNLSTAKDYLVRGWQMVNDGSETGTELLIDGEKVTNEKKFKPKKTEGVVELTFTFDASELAGKELVTFEELYEDNLLVDKLVAEHKDIEDQGQTVSLRELEISTQASFEKTGSKVEFANGEVTIIDVISYEGLNTKKDYLIKGWQMINDGSETGKPLLVDGKRVANEKKFRPKKTKGTLELEFTFDASMLGGKKLVTFEELYEDKLLFDKLVAEHKDIEDRGQTVELRDLEVSTKASFKNTNSDIAYADGKVTIVDEVEYENLATDTAYMWKGWQMVKDGSETGKPLLVDGEKVEEELIFKPKQSKGTFKIEFTFESAELGGKELVSFGKLYNYADAENPKLIVKHEDIENTDQTVSFEALEIKTKARFKENKEQLIDARKKITIIDEIAYENLDTKTEYLIKGYQMLKDDSEAGIELFVDGKKVENEITFVPEESKGTIKLEFTFNASELSGRKLVTFESLFNNSEPMNPRLIAEHRDIDSKDQTVTFKGKQDVVKTGDESGLYLLGVVMFVSGISAMFLLFCEKRQKKIDKMVRIEERENV